jgi:ribosomal protein S18 acetylase RimI-like enzyme
LEAFWGDRDVMHLHHPLWFRQLGAHALAARREDGLLVGYLLGFVVSPVGYVHAVAVRSGMRMGGVASALYSSFLERATAAGADVVEAITTPSNKESVAFHRRLGFHDELVADYAAPGQPRVLFRRALRETRDR